MVKRVSLFQTADGATFETEALAKEHEAKIAAKVTVAALLKKLKLDGSFIGIGEEETLALDTFLLDNRTALLEALVGVKAEKKTRQPRKPKNAPATPAVKEEPVCEAAAPAAVEAAAAAAEPETSSADALDSLVAQLG